MKEKYNILVVDDEVELATIIMESIEIEYNDEQIAFTQAIHGEDALEKISDFSGEFDLILTDLKMPVMNGIDFCRSLHDKKVNVPIIVFTGHGESKEEEELMKLGALSMIKKPYVNKLVDKILSVLPPSA